MHLILTLIRPHMTANPKPFHWISFEITHRGNWKQTLRLWPVMEKWYHPRGDFTYVLMTERGRRISLENNSVDSGLRLPSQPRLIWFFTHLDIGEKKQEVLRRKPGWGRRNGLHSHGNGEKNDSQLRFSLNATLQHIHDFITLEAHFDTITNYWERTTFI